MDEPKQISADVFEGTWEELSQVASNFNGHRLRVQVLPQASSPIIWAKPGAYAAWLEEISKDLPPPTEEDIRKEEEDILEMKLNMNENRRREGAEILFPDV